MDAVMSLQMLLWAVFCLTSTIESAATECKRPPPGVRKMVRGVDITAIDLVPLDILWSNGFKSPVLNFTCNKGRIWTNPEGVEYDLPDQIWHMTTLPGGFLAADASLYKSVEDIRNGMAKRVGGQCSFWKFAFSGSKSYSRMKNTIEKHTRYITDVFAFDSATRVDFNPAWIIKLDEFVQMYVDLMITDTFESDPRPYHRFIEEFGTHYFASANFGGCIREVFETEIDYFKSHTDLSITRKAKASFLKIFSIEKEKTSTSTTIDEKFEEDSSQVIRYYGGDTNLLAENNFREWQPTIDADPWLFSGTLRPISQLIANQTKRASMELAVETYVMQNYLPEVEQQLAAAKAKFKDESLNILQNRISDLKTKTVLTERDIHEFLQALEEQVSAPAWFLNDTELCFKANATGNIHQCEMPNHTANTGLVQCAKPNNMTGQYLDKTDERDGGCTMQWGVFSVGFPSWFSQVRLCFRWYPDSGARTSECGGNDAEPEICAGLNAYSLPYLDDTRYNGGGCHLSWKLEVPNTAPLWLRTSQLCLSWQLSPSSSTTACGYGSPQDLCAVANQWTEHYRDNTYSEDGPMVTHREGNRIWSYRSKYYRGCILSWGIKLPFQEFFSKNYF